MPTLLLTLPRRTYPTQWCQIEWLYEPGFWRNLVGKIFKNPWKLYQKFLYKAATRCFIIVSVFHPTALKVDYTSKMNLLTSFGFILAINFAPWFYHSVLSNGDDPFFSFNRMSTPFLYTSWFSQVRHTISSGVCWFGIPCSSWVFMTLGWNFSSVEIYVYIWYKC